MMDFIEFTKRYRPLEVYSEERMAVFAPIPGPGEAWTDFIPYLRDLFPHKVTIPWERDADAYRWLEENIGGEVISKFVNKTAARWWTVGRWLTLADEPGLRAFYFERSEEAIAFKLVWK